MHRHGGPCVSGNRENKMPTKSPVIKFSPFEALLIGEKNKIVKLQPMKNTIYVKRRFNQRRKTFNLRDLFDLEQETKKSNRKDVVFKIPQRVKEYLKSPKLKLKGLEKRDKQDILFWDCNGAKMVLKNSRPLKSKNAKVKSNKIKFKEKVNHAATSNSNSSSGTSSNSKNSSQNNINNIYNYNNRVVKKFPSHVSRLRHLRNSKITRTNISGDFIKKSKCTNPKSRHSLRGKDGKFISKQEYEDIKSGNTSTPNSPKQPCSEFEEKDQSSLVDSDKNESIKNLQPDDNRSDVCDVPHDCHMTALPAVSTESTDNNDKFSFHKINFLFPKYPIRESITEDFDDDENLMDLVFEKFPVFEFRDSQNLSPDFTECLRSEGMLPPEKNVKIYEKKKNGFFSSDKLTVIFNNHIPYIRPRRMEIGPVKSLPGIHSVKNGFPTIIDEPPCTKENHLINIKALDCFFLRSTESKKIVIGNLMKQFLPNSWFGRLPDV